MPNYRYLLYANIKSLTGQFAWSLYPPSHVTRSPAVWVYVNHLYFVHQSCWLCGISWLKVIVIKANPCKNCSQSRLIMIKKQRNSKAKTTVLYCFFRYLSTQHKNPNFWNFQAYCLNKLRPFSFNLCIAMICAFCRAETEYRALALFCRISPLLETCLVLAAR